MAKRIFICDDEGFGDGADVTDAVGALYDLALSSMDYRSGFWSYEDAAPVATLAELMNYEQREAIQKYRDDQLHNRQTQAFIRSNALGNQPVHYTRNVITRDDGSMIVQHKVAVPEHDHVFSTPGRCMWPKCEVTES
jgi:hypothetical protein